MLKRFHAKVPLSVQTELRSNNMAVKGVAGFYGGTKKHMVTTQTESRPTLLTASSHVLEGGSQEVGLVVNVDWPVVEWSTGGHCVCEAGEDTESQLRITEGWRRRDSWN